MSTFLYSFRSALLMNATFFYFFSLILFNCLFFLSSSATYSAERTGLCTYAKANKRFSKFKEQRAHKERFRVLVLSAYTHSTRCDETFSDFLSRSPENRLNCCCCCSILWFCRNAAPFFVHFVCTQSKYFCFSWILSVVFFVAVIPFERIK